MPARAARSFGVAGPSASASYRPRRMPSSMVNSSRLPMAAIATRSANAPTCASNDSSVMVISCSFFEVWWTGARTKMAMPVRSYRPLAVGVETVRGAVAGAIDAAIGGRGSLVFITGEAGMGKTTAARGAATSAAAAGARALWGASWPDDMPAHGPWLTVLAELGDAGMSVVSALAGTDAPDPATAAAARAGAYARVVDAL